MAFQCLEAPIVAGASRLPQGGVECCWANESCPGFCCLVAWGEVTSLCGGLETTATRCGELPTFAEKCPYDSAEDHAYCDNGLHAACGEYFAGAVHAHHCGESHQRKKECRESVQFACFTGCCCCSCCLLRRILCDHKVQTTLGVLN